MEECRREIGMKQDYGDKPWAKEGNWKAIISRAEGESGGELRVWSSGSPSFIVITVRNDRPLSAPLASLSRVRGD